ncbi:DUF805 domain-containing protein [Microvirga sp. 2MCAF38]|uniref:DUF805 domain-containing protein n=1 Tax=Microvirga sp. 2MCAF38 TaxID=3232989 RepID=UPI003F9A163F
MERFSTLLQWFDPRGRLSRNAYLRIFLRQLILIVAVLVAGVWLSTTGIRAAGFVAVFAIAVILLSSLVLQARRLHDRNRSGWWIVVSLAIGFSTYWVDGLRQIYPISVLCSLLVGALIQIWLIIEILFRRGTPGPNRYGPDPRDLPGEGGEAPASRIPPPATVPASP